MTELSDVQWAERFAALGGSVFPFKMIDGDKVPLVRWKDEAASHPVDIAMLAASYPERSGWGYVPPPGQVVVDLDIKRGHDGPAAWERENADRLECPEPTISWSTRSGGRAQLYRCEGHLPNTAGKLAPGVDTRGPDGWQAIPGSEGYAIERWAEGTLAPAPAWVPQAIRERASAFLEGGTDVEIDRPPNIRRAWDWLKRAEPAVSGEGGNDHTFKTAAVVRDMGVSAELCWELMQKEGGWNDRNDPPWDGDELARIVANAYKYAKHEPGAKALDDPHRVFAHIELPADDSTPNRFRLSGLEALRRRPPPSWLIDDFVPEKSVGFFVGASMTYKTFSALAACIAVASGTSWYGQDAVEGRAVYASTEGTAGLSARAVAHCEANGIPVPTPDRFALTEDLPQLTSPDDVQAFVDALAPLKPTLVVLDHLAGMSAGVGMKEDETATTAVQAMKAISRALGCTVMTVHHENKTGTYYGSAFIEALADFVVSQKVDEGGGKHATIGIGKMKDASMDPTIKIVGEPREVRVGPQLEDTTETLVFRTTEDQTERERDEVRQAAAQARTERQSKPDISEARYMEAAKAILQEAVEPEIEFSDLVAAVAERCGMGSEDGAKKRVQTALRSWKAHDVPELRDAAIGGNVRAKGVKRWEPTGFRTAAFE